MKINSFLRSKLVISFIFIFIGNIIPNPSYSATSDVEVLKGIQTTKVYYSPNCTGEETTTGKAAFFAAIGAAILPQLIEQGIVFITDLIKGSDEDKKAAFSGSVSESLYSISGGKMSFKHKCLVIARGKFGELKKADASWEKDYLLSGDVGMIERPDFYMELKMDYMPMSIRSATGKPETLNRLHLQAHTMELRDAAASKGSKKDIVITTNFSFPAQSLPKKSPSSNTGSSTEAGAGGSNKKKETKTKDTSVEFSLVLPKITIEEEQKYTKDALQHIKSNSGNIPGLAIEENIAKGLAGSFVPFDVVVNVSEVANGDGDKWYMTILDAIGKSKSEIAKSVSGSVFPDQAKKDSK